MSVYDEYLTAGATITGSIVISPRFAGIVTQSMQVTGTLADQMTYNPTMVEGAKATALLAIYLNSGINVGATASASMSYLYTAGGLIHEVAKARDAYLIGSIWSISLSDLALVSDIIQATIGAALTEGATISAVLQAAAGAFMYEKARISGTPLTSSTFNLFATDAITAVDGYMAFFGLSMNASAKITPALVAQYVASVQVLQNIFIHDESTASAIFNPIMAEDCTLSDTALLGAIFNSAIVLEEAYITVAYCGPDSSTSTWVINTRTNAVSEYVNWNFNSFANIGRKYIGANASGIYELNGARDGIVNIVADVAGGYMQFNGAKLSGLKGVYIGLNGQGEYFLKLNAGDGRTYMYQFNSQPGLMSTKVNVGKGLRSRYLQWELISTGPDFDLDTIEFVPMVGFRRV